VSEPKESGAKTPEEALDRARLVAARRRGGYSAGALESSFTSEWPSAEALGEWAVIAVEPDILFSSRRGGAPVTALKRLLVRLLRQYLGEMEAQQTRFNISVVAKLQELEDRLERVERAAAESPDETTA
jgi:hypothetical protein